MTPTNSTNKNKTMKILIRHTQDSIDPSGSYSDEQFPEVRESLEKEYSKALEKEFPGVEIDFEDSSDTYSIVVSDLGDEDPADAETEVQRICETVFETGLFWS